MSITLYTMKQILNWEDPTDPGVVEDLLFPGQLSLLIGSPKAGKTTLARTLALAVTRGHEWMGRPTRKGRVIMFQIEGAPLHERDCMTRLGAKEDDDLLMSVGQIGSTREDFLTEATEVIEKYKPALLIVDTLFRALRIADGNDYATALEAMESILAVVRDGNTHVLCIHHARKGQSTTENDISLGSNALTGTSDTNLFLVAKATRSKQPDRARKTYLSSNQRYGRPLETTPVRMDPETGWVYADSSESRADKVLNILEAAPGKWHSYARLRDEAGLSADAFTAVAMTLLKTNRVKKCGTGVAGDPRKLKLIL